MFKKVLVANRGVVARRIVRALNEMKLHSVAVFSEADVDAPYVREASEALLIGPAPPSESYLHQERLLRAIRDSKADAVHPGYGFLSENAAFAAAVERLGVRFIGPSTKWLDALGHKTNARELMAANGLDVGLGSPVLTDIDDFLSAARQLGYPVLVKPAEGGGGIGMVRADDAYALRKAVAQAQSVAERSFGSAALYLERYLQQPRHIEFQVLADAQGARHLFERDCSIQRRHQKVIEECPAPNLARDSTELLADKIANVMGAMGYDNIGTVEMLRATDGTYGFLEVNTRLQVEHGVTEMATGIDLVKSQIRLAAGLPLREVLPATLALGAHAIEARIYAEDSKRFFPSPGLLRVFRPPEMADVRIEAGYIEGQQVTTHYDPLLAKVIAVGDTRAAAVARLDAALAEFAIDGCKCNIPALRICLADEQFRAGQVHTGLLTELVGRA